MKIWAAGWVLLAATAVAQVDPQRGFDAATAAMRPAGTKVRVELIGDSTQTENAGHGRGFCAKVAAGLDCVNMASGEASTKTFRTLGLWDGALTTKRDYMLIQFGHNDREKVDGTAENDRQVAMAVYAAPEGGKTLKVIPGGPVKIVLVGDSTVATGGGWGPGFCKVMTPNVTCVDLALNGRSSKSFIDEGAWKKALAEKGDYYLIQFGHNDQKTDEARHTDAEGSFQGYLKRYCADVRAIGGVPVLVTSLSRRTFKDGQVVQDLKAYADATKKVGAELGITVVDLNAMSTALLNHMTQEQADAFDAVGHADAAAENAKPTLDRTHLNAHGQEVFGRMVADALVRTQVELGPDVQGEAAGKSVVPSFAVQQAAPKDRK